MGHTYQAKLPHTSGLISWSREENLTWEKLIKRQRNTIENRACEEFIRGLEAIDFERNGIPQHMELNEKLMLLTGWKVEPVGALISDTAFHTLLSKRRFPGASFIRIRAELDYLEEPDIFHEFFGHLPLLAWKPYADFIQRFGAFALHIDAKYQKYLSRIFWFTVEFGLIDTCAGTRIFGAGILSSHGETIRALADPSVKHIGFDPLLAARTPYRHDVMQSQYFILHDFDQLFSLLDFNLLDILEKAHKLGDIP